MSDVVEKLKQLKELLDDGVLTQEEFDAQKNQLRLPMEVVTVPAGAVGGQQLTLQMPSGSTRQVVVPAGLKAGDKFRVAAPVPQEMHAENTPELEYTVDDECYWICSGGGSQKIKLYKDDIAFEQTCPAPVLGVCCFPCGTVPIDVACCLSCVWKFRFANRILRVSIPLGSVGQKDGHPHALPPAQERSAELQRGWLPLLLLIVFPINLLHRRSLWA